MKKNLYISLSATAIVVGIFILLNINVVSKQCINYRCHTINMPLYLKLLDFFDRHYNYKELTNNIIKNEKDKSAKVMRLFEWTYANIRKVPDSFPIVDDHVWHIIIRGYGVDDQVSDVFTTLCNYAGIDAFYSSVYGKDKKSKIILSLVKLNNEWRIFDPYNGTYFQNYDGKFACLKDMQKKEFLIKRLDTDINYATDYTQYLDNLSPISNVRLQRAQIQSPLHRFIFEIKKWFHNS